MGSFIPLGFENVGARMIGIFGGSFDPVHRGHLALCERVSAALPLKKIYILPCYLPVHRGPLQASPQDRVAMLELAFKNYPNFKIDTREIDRAEASYMIDTLKSFQAEFPEEKFALILGADSYQDFKTWKDWQELLQRAELVVVARPGFPMEDRSLPAIFISGDSEISATGVRNQQRWDWLTPEVAAYIREHGLYKRFHRKP